MGLLETLKPVLPQLQEAFLSFPKMPANTLGLKNGDILRCDTDELGSFAKRGLEFPIFYDGEYIRCSRPRDDGTFTGPSWGVEQFCSEIRENKWWLKVGSIYDSANPH